MRRLAALLIALLALAGAAAWWVAERAPDVTETRPANETETIVSTPDVTEPPRRHRVAAPTQDAHTTPADEVTEAPEDGKKKCVVRVLRASDGEPVVGLRVRPANRRGDPQPTDLEGRVAFDAPTDGPPLIVTAHAPGVERVELSPGETVVRVPDPVPLDVVLVDAETGQPFTSGLTKVSVVDGRGPLDGSGTLPAPLWHGHEFDLQLEVRVLFDRYCPPPDADLRRRGTISRYAERAVVHVPIPRAARLRVEVRDSAGRPVEAAQVSASGCGRGGAARTGADGVARPEGIPHRRGERVLCTAGFEGRAASVWSEPLVSPDAETVVRIELPDEPDTTVSITGGAGSSFRTGRSSRRSSGEPEGTGAVVVQLQRRDGRPAAGVRVALWGPRRERETTDDAGFATFDGLPEGRYRLSADEHGLLTAVAEIELAAGETRQVLLREPEGRALHLRVVDASGRPLPFARVQVRDAHRGDWVRLERDVQHLDLFADAAGEVHVEHVPPGALIVSAWYGTRTAEVTLREDDPLLVTIPDPPVPGR